MKRWTNGLPGATKRLGAMMVGRDLSASQPGSARIPMMARSINAPLQRPNTLMQLSRSSILEFRLATHGRAIHLAQLGPSDFAGIFPLVGVKRTRRRCAFTAEFDPKRTIIDSSAPSGAPSTEFVAFDQSHMCKTLKKAPARSQHPAGAPESRHYS